MFDLETYHELDLQISEYIFSVHTPFLNWFFENVTLLGNTEVVTVLTTLLVGSLLYKRKNYFAYLALIVVVGSTTSTHLLKLVFGRPRPELHIAQLETYSFPSGHATAAMALFGVTAYIVYKLSSKNYYRYGLLAILLLLVVLVGFSRIYLGYHYTTDVLAGYLVGAIWLAVSIHFFKK